MAPVILADTGMGLTSEEEDDFRERAGPAAASSQAEPDCVGRMAGANASGGPKGERHGRRESIHLDLATLFQGDNGFRITAAPHPE